MASVSLALFGETLVGRSVIDVNDGSRSDLSPTASFFSLWIIILFLQGAFAALQFFPCSLSSRQLYFAKIGTLHVQVSAEVAAWTVLASTGTPVSLAFAVAIILVALVTSIKILLRGRMCTISRTCIGDYFACDLMFSLLSGMLLFTFAWTIATMLVTSGVFAGIVFAIAMQVLMALCGIFAMLTLSNPFFLVPLIWGHYSLATANGGKGAVATCATVVATLLSIIVLLRFCYAGLLLWQERTGRRVPKRFKHLVPTDKSGRPMFENYNAKNGIQLSASSTGNGADEEEIGLVEAPDDVDDDADDDDKKLSPRRRQSAHEEFTV